MSGVTPILDTLLHQVLGRRDAPVARPVSERPITPARASHGAGTLYSDSRLDPRAAGVAQPGTKARGKVSGEAAFRGGNRPVASPEAVAVSTRLGTAAKAIATILSQHHAPPSAVQAGTPPASMSGHVEPAVLAGWLRQSIQSSGLFYEVHLLRWYQGLLPRALLLLEPQMRHSARAKPKRGSAHGAAGTAKHAAAAGQGSLSSRPAPGTGQGSHGPLPSTPLSADMKSAPWPGSGESAQTANAGQLIHSGLESTVRHQLELLANPVLRWQGTPLPGMSLAWVLEPPDDATQERQRDGDADTTRPDADASAWRSRLRVRVKRLGELELDVRIRATQVMVDMRVPEPAAQPLQACQGHLHERLTALGFEQVRLHIHEQGGGDGA